MATTFLNLGIFFDRNGDVFRNIVHEELLIPQTHEYLFNFLDTDLSRLDLYLDSYLSCISGSETTKGDSVIMQQLYDELFKVHPFFRTSPENASTVINFAIANYIKGVCPDDEAEQLKLFSLAGTTLYNTGDVEASFYLDRSTGHKEEHLFEELYELQEDISNWVFIALDNSNPDMAKMSGIQRNAIYSTIYGNSFTPLLETTVEKTIVKNTKLGYVSSLMDFDEDFILNMINAITEMKKNPGADTPDIMKQLIEASEGITEDREQYTYITENLDALLKLEVYDMSQNNIRIKRCKNCGRYFILEKNNVEYCNRIAAGETRPCSEIGRARTYEQRVASENNAMTLYRKAYKTHYARIAAGKMTKDDFDAWKAEATTKREQVDSGSLAFEEYTLWLKI
ncbi:MAG: DUF6076 domain-containing protein [Lachnospiraceae bacterium]|nr:DUF6076 domain-containing protein [Lachnospiraceae bacterium]